MPDFNVRSDSVNVEQIMEQIRARIRESRGVDYSEQQVRELAAAKLETLLDRFRRVKPPEQPPNYTFGGDTLFESPVGLLRVIRRLLRPILRLFFNPTVLADALHTQAELNARQARLEASRHMLYDELIHNLVIEAARLGLEVKGLKMRVESLASRLEFSERRARTLESTIAYKPSAEDRAAPSIPPPSLPSSPPPSPPLSASASSPPLASASAPPTVLGRPLGPGPSDTPDGQRRRRRRRRRGRRGGGSGGATLGAPPGERNRGGPGGATLGAPQPSPASADADAAPLLEGDEAPADAFTDDAESDDAGPSTGSGPGGPGDPADPGDNKT